MIKSRRMTWAGNIAGMGKKRNWWESKKEGGH
jgi:hypothetical protein